MALETVGGNFWKESSRQKPTAFRAQSRKTTGKTIDPFSGHGGLFCPVLHECKKGSCPALASELTE